MRPWLSHFDRRAAQRDDLSRRAFLGSAALALSALGGSATLISCRRKAKDGTGTSGTGDDAAQALHNLDDVPDAATFRPPLPASEPVVRVRVMRQRDAKSSPRRIGAPDQWIMLRLEGNREGIEASRHRGIEESTVSPSTPRSLDALTPSSGGHALQGPLEIAMTDSGWSIVDGKGFRASIGGGHDSIELALAADEAEPLLKIESGGSRDSSSAQPRQYRGTLRLVSRHDLDAIDRKGRRTPSRAFDIVNHIPLEQYLPGVLAGELFASWRLETFCAQAVAARSFACTEAAIFADRRHYDLANTTASQMYLGAVVHDKAHQAVQITRGVVLAHENLLVSGYYSSCCGGVAASAADAIGVNPVNNAVPLRGRSGSDVCTEAPVYAWTTEQPLEQLVQRLAAFGRERQLKTLESMQRLVSIDTTATNAHGRPTRITVTGMSAPDRDPRAETAGPESRPAEEVRVELSAEDFRRAANFSSEGGGGGAGSRAEGATSIAIKPPEKELRSSNLRASIVGSTVIFQGNGFGHGVGLCQYGAEALAKSGTAHEDILRWYYPDVEIVRAYT